MLIRNLAGYDRDVKAGEWQRSTEPLMMTYPIEPLTGRKLGIVGYGALGQGVARVAPAFGMDVLVSARPGLEELPDGRVPFDTVLTESDVISLHCPLNDATRNLFGTEQFDAMKTSAILVNTARGGLVDTAALAHALKAGSIAGAAIDVLPEEPPVNGDPLLDYAGDNLVLTPHIAWGSAGARQRAIDELAANTQAFLSGEARNRVV
jgi:glycerate dehydrogenase